MSAISNEFIYECEVPKCGARGAEALRRIATIYPYGFMSSAYGTYTDAMEPFRQDLEILFKELLNEHVPNPVLTASIK